MGNRYSDRRWHNEAIARIEADFNRSADTHLIRLPLPSCPGIDLYFKDESVHPTGSLKHRLARSLILHALCNGWIGPDTVLIEASSGSTAVSEAYFAKLLGLRFIAVMPRSTAREKIEEIAFRGGECFFVDSAHEMYSAAERLAAEHKGHYLDQFTYAERATDWRGNNNIADSIFSQMSREPHPVPTWIVTGAGTGGTSATIGRYIRYHRHATGLCVSDPAGSVFHRYFETRQPCEADGRVSFIEGIGRPRVEPSFIVEVIDRMIAVSDTESIAGAQIASRMLGKLVGGSTGTNFWAVARLAAEMCESGQQGSIVTILCDTGERYRSTIFSEDWRRENNLDTAADLAMLSTLLNVGAG
ncbi:cysteine synthase [Agaricicola taiwanensis]|uniref:L-cysteine desulfhydrase Cds1 n=1 Tax=Agaricicola taiwanensis TaxID=591372 RepID=A0A8J3DX19_9RHOB|nr:PLP-dependent cysteine synthase family protein [Agaricicola taiwanensis]GGE47697.1 cysteine synthase [Agaricicola taiwanensis]